ncbi:MAG: ribosome small subunit-dependent GTPase A, partial [Aeromicrobium sp.]
LQAFPDLDAVTADCSRGCTHTTGEPECALDDAAADCRLQPARVESFRRLLASKEHSGDR